MIVPWLLLAQLFFPAQIAQAQVSPEVAARLEAGADAEQHGDLNQAINEFKKALDLSPSSPVVFFRLGEAYMRERNYAAATAALKRAVELDPNSAPAQQLLGYALLSQGYALEAIPHLDAAHDSGALGVAQLETDQPAEAIVNLKDALAKSPNDPDLLYYLARAGAAVASGANERLLSQFPQTARGHQTLGQSYYAAKMFPEAEQQYRRAIALRPDLPGLHLELGEIFVATSQWSQAEKQFQAEGKLQPGNGEAAYRLGNALLQEGKMKDAAAELHRSDSLRPDMPETLYALGRALADSDPTAAEQVLDRVITLEQQGPLAAQSYLLLASIYRKQGKIELAAHEMKEYRRIQNLASKP